MRLKVTDTFCFIKKSATSKILQEMNNYEKGLQSTKEKMSPEGLNFLDTPTYQDKLFKYPATQRITKINGQLAVFHLYFQ